MNILQQENNRVDQLQNCKMAYLDMENRWMVKEQEFINQLIFKYKTIIAWEHQSDRQQGIAAVREEIRELIEQKKEEYKAERENSLEVQQEITEQEFSAMVLSFEEKIERLTKSIKDRQIQLQTVQENRIKDQGVKQKRLDLRFLGTVDTNGKLIEKVRKDIAKLKAEKNRLQNQLIAAKTNTNIEQQENFPSRALHDKGTKQEQEQEVSTFEKIVMIIKKKRFTNELLQQKIRTLRNKLAQKKVVNEALKKEIEKLEWSCFQNVSPCNGFLDNSSAGQDISILDKTLNNNMSFSLDVSRFILPKFQN